jgi:hypothetical protein
VPDSIFADPRLAAVYDDIDGTRCDLDHYFRHSVRFVESGDTVTSESTLRFRDRDELTTTLAVNGFTITDVRDAPDRPGRELVVIARTTPS